MYAAVVRYYASELVLEVEMYHNTKPIIVTNEWF